MKQIQKPQGGGLALWGVVTSRGSFNLHVSRLKVAPGQTVCIVGPNGGGKTTLLLTVLGLLPHAGDCVVNGMSYDGASAAIKATVGFIPDDPTLLFEELTATEQWELTASVLERYHPTARDESMSRAHRIARAIGFEPPKSIARQYSHGMRKKTQIVNALLGEPSLIVIDELRNGLDPIAIKRTEGLIKSEAARGAAVLAATHDLWWAERFADYVYVLDRGKIAAEGTIASLLQSGERHLEEAFLRIVGVDNEPN